jgi:hypothetical protein
MAFLQLSRVPGPRSGKSIAIRRQLLAFSPQGHSIIRRMLVE